MKEIDYSQTVRRKLLTLKEQLAGEFGLTAAEKSLKRITDAVRVLEMFPEGCPSVSAVFGVDCEYRYLYTGHNYLFYRISGDRVIITEMFDEREDFMCKLFGTETMQIESTDDCG